MRLTILTESTLLSCGFVRVQSEGQQHQHHSGLWQKRKSGAPPRPTEFRVGVQNNWVILMLGQLETSSRQVSIFPFLWKLKVRHGPDRSSLSLHPITYDSLNIIKIITLYKQVKKGTCIHHCVVCVWVYTHKVVKSELRLCSLFCDQSLAPLITRYQLHQLLRFSEPQFPHL